MFCPRTILLALFSLSCTTLGGQPNAANPQSLERFVEHWIQMVDVVSERPLQLEVLNSKGLGEDLRGLKLALMIGGEGQFRVDLQWKKQHFEMGRKNNTVWIYVPEKEFGVWGKNEIPPFREDPDYLETVDLAEVLTLPLSRLQIQALPLLFTVSGESSEGDSERYLLQSNDFTEQRIGFSGMDMEWKFPATGTFPCEVSWIHENRELRVRLSVGAPVDLAEQITIASDRRDQFTEVALSHLTKFARVAYSRLSQRGKPWPEQEEVYRTHGKGKLFTRDGVLIVYLEGSPEEMGEQHGVLLQEQIREVFETMLYGVGVGSSFLRGSWFFGDIEEAQSRLLPYMNPDYLAEMDALSRAAGFHQQEVRLGNFFPELFHCSGFAIYGDATKDGMLYHGRILDYISGLGLEANSVLFIINPDNGHRWVNVGYAGFTGTVTAMNEKGLAIGELGGDGWGDWDGKPMAQLMREVMEQADTVDEGVAIFEKGPRTCEYYYVLSQANPNTAVALYATPDELQVILPGTYHPRLKRPVADTVLLSGGSRYDALVDRVEAEYGEIDAVEAWALMARPVAMRSNIQSALFRPETLDFWVANANHKDVASDLTPAQFNLKTLLEELE